jgi:anti-sigma regulatory factor (Ser/Thr protein kinase)/anti-anti-sigma regulatory factor
MPTSLTCAIDRRSAYTLVRPVGDLDLAGSALVRTTLLKALADQPEAILVDLSGVLTADLGTLSVFLAVGREAARWPAIPLLLCAPSPLVSAHFARAPTLAWTIFPTVSQAALTVGTGAPTPMLVEDMLPIAGAARSARNLVTEACVRWKMPALVPDASIVVSELVANAVLHAGTIFTVRISLRPRYVHIAVRDGSMMVPVIPPKDQRVEGGRGLLLVMALAAAWGHLQTPDGKVVWATLRRLDGDATS